MQEYTIIDCIVYEYTVLYCKRVHSIVVYCVLVHCIVFQEYTVTCGRSSDGQDAAAEEVKIVWVDDYKDYNIG